MIKMRSRHCGKKKGKKQRKCEKDFPEREREGSGCGFLSFSFPTQVEWIQKKSRKKGKSSFYTTVQSASGSFVLKTVKPATNILLLYLR